MYSSAHYLMNTFIGPTQIRLVFPSHTIGPEMIVFSTRFPLESTPERVASNADTASSKSNLKQTFI